MTAHLTIRDTPLAAHDPVVDGKHPRELLQRVIAVSLATMKFVVGLPKVEIPVNCSP